MFQGGSIMKYLLIYLFFLSLFINTAQCKPAKNVFRDNATELSQGIEKIIRQHLSLNKQKFENHAPVLAKNFGVSIRNPFTQLPEATYQAFKQKGIDLKAMSKYKAIYISGHFTGSLALKFINTEADTVLVIGSNTSSHKEIFSRGPVVVLNSTFIMGGIYAKDLIWLNGSEGENQLLGLPYIHSFSNGNYYNLGIGSYSFKEELQAINKLGKNKTHMDQDDIEKIKIALSNKFDKAISTIPLIIKMPSLEKINNTEQKHYYCSVYADSAIEQNSLNIEKRCGFKGLRWNNDKKGQEKWCLSVLNIVSELEDTARKKMLTRCFMRKASSDNPHNKLQLPKGCYNPTNKFTPVKQIYAAYRYRKSLKQVIDNGLIQYDYNKDGKKDFVFVEQSDKKAQITLCMSKQSHYQRLETTMSQILDEGTSDSLNYRVSQKNDLLEISIGLFSHNEGSSSRLTSFRYDTTTQTFKIIKNSSNAYGAATNGVIYEMPTPRIPVIFSQ